jgi:hypothetical protein
MVSFTFWLLYPLGTNWLGGEWTVLGVEQSKDCASAGIQTLVAQPTARPFTG